MKTTIYYNFGKKLWEDDYDNLTIEELTNNKDLLSKSEEFKEWLDYNDYTNKEDEKIDEFKYSDSYLGMMDSYTPIYNIIHLLETQPSSEDLQLMMRVTSNVVAIYIEDLDTYALALTGCGMDMSAYLELAYYIVDNESPIKSQAINTLSKFGQDLLKRARSGDMINASKVLTEIKNDR